MVDEHAEIKPLPDVKRALKGIFKGRPSMCEALVQEHRMEVKKDGKLSS
jgi:hypothetical protein